MSGGESKDDGQVMLHWWQNISSLSYSHMF